jgi:hypothetical protein
MANLILAKNYVAGGPIAAHRIVAFGAADGVVVQAASAADLLIGATELPVETGERVDIVRVGLADIEFGGTVTRGQPVTADASGKAVAATYGTTAVRSLGIAEVSAVAGDIAPVLIVPALLTPDTNT